MASVEKIIQKMKNQPNGLRAEEVGRVLEAYGYRLDRQKGSHMQYINDNGDVITIKETLINCYKIGLSIDLPRQGKSSQTPSKCQC